MTSAYSNLFLYFVFDLFVIVYGEMMQYLYGKLYYKLLQADASWNACCHFAISVCYCYLNKNDFLHFIIHMGYSSLIFPATSYEELNYIYFFINKCKSSYIN